MIDLLTREEVREDETGDDGPGCVSCPCRPHVSYCGKYNGSTEVNISDPGPDDCAECYRCWDRTGCPNCGCVRDDACRLCGHGWRQ